MKIFYLFLILLINGPFCSAPQDGKKKDHIYYTVTKVIDGDTFWIDNGFENPLKIRLTGINAPEARNSHHKVKSFYGKESYLYLKRMIEGKKVRLEYDIGRYDRYKRTLAYVYLPDDTFVNAELVKNGYASIMTIQPNVKYQELFSRLERKARNKEKGLWGKSKEKIKDTKHKEKARLSLN